MLVFNEYQVFHKDKFIGIFRDRNAREAIKQAWEAEGYSSSKLASLIETEYTAIQIGLLGEEDGEG